MTPEREKLIRDTYLRAEASMKRLLLKEPRVNMLLKFTPPPPFGASPAEAPLGDHIVTVTRKVREITWSAECEGLELGTYRIGRP